MEERARPRRFHQFVLADQLAATLYQQVQQLECASAQFHGAPIEEKQLAAGNQLESAEGEGEFLSAYVRLLYRRGRPH
ncbi:hypothetical protein [Bradyrhizobium sp. 192]|uniref:hypothetical protein n=1 Tax=Bradyrhizobium sp. 192 TaxID=2782660 RepID=UPI001FFF164E|nr:hypothetical protein [Bradyrhizobium sp. 192]